MSKIIFGNNSTMNEISNENNNDICNTSQNIPDKITLEENSINNLIKEIYNLNQKLNELKSDNIIEPKVQKLSLLKNTKKNLENNIAEIKSALSYELKKNEISQEHKKVLINELDQKIIDIKSKINLYNNNISNFNSIELIKYIYENKIIYNNDFLTREQIEIVSDTKNYLSNNNEIKKILKEKEVNRVSENIIQKNILEKNSQKNQLKENLEMLNEEKLGTLEELNDIISYKESIEEGMKFFCDKLRQKNNKDKNKDNIELNEPLDILINELINIDTEKASMRICDELYKLLNENRQKNENINDKFFIINNQNNTSFISNIETNPYEFTKLNNNQSNSKAQKRSESNNTTYRNEHQKKYIKNNEIENSDKKLLNRLIKNEIDTFINTHKYCEKKSNNQIFDKNLLNDFLFNLSMIIINKIKTKKDKNFMISSNDLMIYLSLFFKYLYYEKILDENNSFINQEYNLIKNTIKNQLNEIEKEKIKLEDKLTEIKLKQKINQILEELIHKKNKAKEESKCDDEYLSLTKEEISYIDLCKEFIDLNDQKEKIKNENDKNNNNFLNKKNDIEMKIDEYNIQLNIINKEINELNNFIEIIRIKNNEEMIECKKIIDDKSNKIKIELNSYKIKYNNDKYNIFIDKIKHILKSFNLNNSFLDNMNDGNISKDYNKSENKNDSRSIIDYNYYNNKYNINNKKIKNGYFNENNNSNSMNINIKKLNKSMTIIKNTNNINNNYPLYDEAFTNTNKSFLFKKQILNNSKNLEEETKSNYNLPIKPKKQNIYNIYNISLLPNVINKNKSTTNIHTKIKEIKKLKSNKKIPISNKLFPSKNIPSILSENNSSTLSKNTTQSLSHGKNKINQNNSKIELLHKSIICYCRELSLLEDNKNIIKYNPLNNIDFDILCASPYNFQRVRMNLNNKSDIIIIKIYNEKKNLEIKLEDIISTFVNSNIKKIIEIYRNYNKNKFNNNFSFEEFVNKEKNKFNEMSKEDIIKSALNQNFIFSLVTKNEKRFEFIIRSYEEFKIWINGLAYIIKNKK